MSRKQQYRAIRGNFVRGFFMGLGALSAVGATVFNPPLYPRNAQYQDQRRIGGDMYRAFGRYHEETKTLKATKAK